jgi:hypothetical protein
MLNDRHVALRFAVLSAVLLALGVDRAHAKKYNFEFLPPATPTNKSTGPGDVPGWGRLVVMFTANVTTAQYSIADSPCPNFMDVPGFTGPASTISLLPPGPTGTGYRIPVGKKVTIMVESDDNNLMVKPGAGSPPTPTFWQYKGNESDTRNVPAQVVPEPSALALALAAVPLMRAAKRRRRM